MICYTKTIINIYCQYLHISLVVAFTTSYEYPFQDFDEHPQPQYCNDYVSHITDLLLIITCKDTKKYNTDESIILTINVIYLYFEVSGVIKILY